MYRLNTQGVNAAINFTSDEIGADRTLKTLLVHVSAAYGAAENLVVTLDSYLGSDYDTALVTQDLNGLTDYTSADINVQLHKDDKLKVTFGNSESKTVSVQLIME